MLEKRAFLKTERMLSWPWSFLHLVSVALMRLDLSKEEEEEG